MIPLQGEKTTGIILDKTEEITTYVARFRLYYLLFVILLFLTASPLWETEMHLLLPAIALSVAYFFLRHLKWKTANYQIQFPLEALDFVFIGCLVYLSGGIMGSFLLYAYIFLVASSAVKFGVAGVVLGCLFAMLSFFLLFIINSGLSFPTALYHIASVTGTAFFTGWTVLYHIVKIQNLKNSLCHMSYTDSLTGLYNSAYLWERGREEINRCRRQGKTFSLIFMDLDGFKKINDSYGHLTGDKMLRQVACLLQKHSRDDELLVRYAGDEFVLLIPGGDKKEACRAAERLLLEIRSCSFHGGLIRLDFSAGTAVYPEDGSSLKELIQAADLEMYKNKHGQ